jgi:hypothetical protein
MSQIDKIIYLPLLFWFIILLFILYFFIFSYFFSIFLSILKVRIIFYKEIKNNCIQKYTNLIHIYNYYNISLNLLVMSINYFINRYSSLKVNNK